MIKVLQMSLISYNQKSISNLTENDEALLFISTIHILNAYGTFYVKFLFSALTNIVKIWNKVVWLVVDVDIECLIPITWKRICSTATNRFNKILFF